MRGTSITRTAAVTARIIPAIIRYADSRCQQLPQPTSPPLPRARLAISDERKFNLCATQIVVVEETFCQLAPLAHRR